MLKSTYLLTAFGAPNTYVLMPEHLHHASFNAQASASSLPIALVSYLAATTRQVWLIHFKRTCGLQMILSRDPKVT